MAALSATSLNHTMVAALPDKPTYGLTLGMADIMQVSKIILLIWGKDKENVTRALLSRRITTQLPASLLWLHADASCFVGGST